MTLTYLILILAIHGQVETLSLPTRLSLFQCTQQAFLLAEGWLARAQTEGWEGYTLKAARCGAKREGSA